LYFESLEGYLNPSRFTPMNEDVRRDFQAKHNIDPLDLYREESPLFHKKTATGMRAFLEYRSDLAKHMQEEWIEELEKIRATKTHLDLVLTHVDDRFDTQMRDLIGADAGRLLPILDRHDITFLIEDPATIWHLGPERYPEIYRRYLPLTTRHDKLAIDINIVERYQDVYPTKQQTGTELFQLVHLAARAFRRVALYFEYSILTQDIPLLPAAIAVVDHAEQQGDQLLIRTQQGVGVPWKGPVKVNGHTWPVQDDQVVWLPAGECKIEPANEAPTVRVVDFNGDLQSAAVTKRGVEVAYRSSSRAFMVLDKAPSRVEIDGELVTQPRVLTSAGRHTLVLPRGQHIVNVDVNQGMPEGAASQ
jgi:hypothetical protein